ncbi:hypothetical protein HK405_014539, partial [Cladochytrium tenue]
PAGMGYIAYLIYSLVVNHSQFPLMCVIMIAAIYGLQAIIFIIKRKWAQIGWMVIYIISMPVTSLYVPIYSFWHFDDFSWGNTRLVTGEDGKQVLTADVVPFDPASIPARRWADHERDLDLDADGNDDKDARSLRSDSRQSADRASLASSSKRSHSSRLLVTAGAAPAYAAPPSIAGSHFQPTYYPTTAGSVVVGAYPPSAYAASAAGGYDPSAAAAAAYAASAAAYAASAAGGLPYAASTAAGPVPFVPGPDGLPTDDALLRELRALLATADLMSITKKQTRDALAARFGVDLTPKRAVVNKLIEDVLQGRA